MFQPVSRKVLQDKQVLTQMNTWLVYPHVRTEHEIMQALVRIYGPVL